MLIERASKRFAICLLCGAAGHDDDVELAQSLPMQAEAFSYQALDAVSVSGVTYVLLGEC